MHRDVFSRGAFSRNVFIMIMALASVCLGAACLGSAAAQAQQPSPAAVAVARDVILAKGVGGIVEPVVRGVIENVKNKFVPTNPNLTRELNEVAVILHKELDGKSNEVIDQMAQVYAARFTEQELKDLLAFYKSPLGQKSVREEPVAIDEGLRGAERWTDAFAETVMARMRSEMQKKGHPL
jgi:uncharacterized protein